MSLDVVYVMLYKKFGFFNVIFLLNLSYTMRNFPCSFAICTTMYVGVAILGYIMFGDATLSQYTLNMPQDLVATKIAVWTTVCSF